MRGPVGAGGMGEVYRASDPRLQREVAIKVLPRTIATDPGALDRFTRETRAVATLSHPNILVLHDVGNEGDLHYAVTELLEGETLAERIARGPLPWRQVVEIGSAVADGLAAAHARGLVHRDIKPANLFLTTDRRVKILDFGLAAPPTAEADSNEPANRPGTIVGSLGYISPEQAAGDLVDARSDLFSLGCVLYEMLTGQRAFQARDPVRTLTAIVRNEPPPLVDLAPETPPALARVVERCLRKQREERFVSASDLAFELRAVARAIDEPAESQPPETPRFWTHAARFLSRLAHRLRPAGPPRSLAVVPFENAGPDLGTDYLSDGIAESVVRILSRLESPRVLAWGTVARFRGRAADPVELAAELGVDAILRGRVSERTGRLLVSVELIEARRGDCLASEVWDRQSTDLFEIQEQIAREIVERLRRRFGPVAPERPTPSLRVEADAYRSYLKGRHLWNQRTAEALRKSVDFFREALDTDPAFPLAWAGLADALNVQPFWGILSPQEAFPEARDAAAEALRLQPDLAEGHAALAYSLFYFAWDWQAAERHFRRALEVSPNYATARHWYGVCLGLVGAPFRARSELRRARELDPLSPMINADLALVHYLDDAPDRAVEQCDAVLELDPQFAPALLYRGMALEQLGRHGEAIRALEKAVQRSPGGTTALSALAHVLASAGQPDEAGRILVELGARAKRTYVSPYLLGVVHAGLGETGPALDWLRRARDERSEMMVWVGRDPRLRRLSDNPRYRELVADVGTTTAVEVELPPTRAEGPVFPPS